MEIANLFSKIFFYYCIVKGFYFLNGRIFYLKYWVCMSELPLKAMDFEAIL